MSLEGFFLSDKVKLVVPHPLEYRKHRRFPMVDEVGIVTDIITWSRYTFTKVLLVRFLDCDEEWEKLPKEVEMQREDMWPECEAPLPPDWKDHV